MLNAQLEAWVNMTSAWLLAPTRDTEDIKNGFQRLRSTNNSVCVSCSCMSLLI